MIRVERNRIVRPGGFMIETRNDLRHSFQWSLPSFSVVIVAEHGSNSLAALFTTASNTGCTSDGELAMTFRMSAVAVCRSSASLVSLNSRAFSMAITAWSAKVRSSWT